MTWDHVASGPACARDRQIEREIWQSSRLAKTRPVERLTLRAIRREYPPPDERTVAVCLYVPPPPYPRPRHG